MDKFELRAHVEVWIKAGMCITEINELLQAFIDAKLTNTQVSEMVKLFSEIAGEMKQNDS